MLSSTKQRFHLIDALRGIAALGVVLFHTYLGMLEYVPESWNPVVDVIIRSFRWNVMIFFVLSGFVIAYSIRHLKIDGKFAGDFCLRRSIRLDPPYWAMLLLMYGLSAGGLYLFPSSSKAVVPPWSELWPQFLYLQDLLGEPNYLVVAWTLCLEIQFYLFMILTLWMTRGSIFWSISIFLLAMGAGILQKVGLFPPVPGLFITFFYSFLGGALLWWYRDQKVSILVLGAYLVGIFSFYIIQGDQASIATLATFAFLFAASYFDKLSWGNWAPLQFLGRISYSLYLTHMLIGNKLTGLFLKFIPEFSLPVSICIYALEVIGAIVFAAIFYRLVEQPCLALCRRIRERPLQPQSNH